MPGCCPWPSAGLGLRPFFFILGGKPMSPRKKSSAEDDDEGDAVEGAAPMPETMWFMCEAEGPSRGEVRPEEWPV